MYTLKQANDSRENIIFFFLKGYVIFLAKLLGILLTVYFSTWYGIQEKTLGVMPL
jgi:hypothetical protein